MIHVNGPVETRRLLMSTVLGRCVLAAWLALVLLVGVAGYATRNSVDQSVWLLLVAGAYCALLGVAPSVDRLARR
ncbi:MAG: hypothetical protein QOK10_3360 [Pseudonocardiales bacterium]|jgi:hypothetical protein|nr:hypothetical protein [Pseudonocardiales bacterium]